MYMWYSVLWLIVCSDFILASKGARSSDERETPPVVSLTESCTVKGRISRAVDSEIPVYNFRGIYYAAPPVGKRRFAPPVKRKPIEGSLDATQFGPLCPQNVQNTERLYGDKPLPTRETSEDCLHLNIYTPSLDTGASLPVLVYFSVGAFRNGGGGFYDGTALAAHHQVVVVTVSSRIGALGYLSTEDVSAPGNYGLLDQGAALTWVGEEIRKFGGDPQMITIMGESAGGMSVSLHLLADIHKGLFKRVIAQSGVATSPLTIINDPKSITQELASALLCPTANTKVMVDCLRQHPADKIAGMKFTNSPIEFGPVIDGFFLKRDPKEIQNEGALTRKELLLGYTSDEGSASLLDYRGSAKSILNFLNAKTFYKFLEQMLSMIVPKELPVSPLIKAISNVYIGSEGIKNDDQAKQLFSDIVTDCMFAAPAVATADALSEGRLSVFMYEFAHRTTSSSLPSWARADHGDDEAYVWGEPFMDSGVADSKRFSEKDRDLSRKMMLYFTNFVKYGNPNGNSKPTDSYQPLPHWPAYTKQTRQYIQLDASLKVQRDPRSDKITFWNKLFSFWKVGKRRKEEL